MTSVPGAHPFAEELEKYRKAHGLTPAQLARAIGASTSQVSRWRSGGGISIAQLQLVADWMGRPRADLEPLAGYPVRVGNALSAHATSDPRLRTISAVWANLDECRRVILHEVALAGLSTGTPAQPSTSTSSTARQSTDVRGQAASRRFTGRDLEDLLRRLPQTDPDFEADLAQIRNEWRAARRRNPNRD